MDFAKIESNMNKVMAFEIEELLEMLPYDGSYNAKFTHAGKNWIFKFSFNSVGARFNAIGSGSNPRDAFATARLMLLRQVRQWRQSRFCEEFFDGRNSAQGMPTPAVLIVDDDVESAVATEFMFKQLGCRTQIVCDPEGVHRKLSSYDADLILLDWKLSPELEGAEVIERANRLIETFSDLRLKFENTRTRVITHSVLPKSEISLPQGGYFRHFDHWQKPLQYNELVTRGSDALSACGF